MFAFLVIPAALGLLVARGLKGTFAVAMGAALVAVFLGIWFSYRFDFPSGPMIVAVLGGLLLAGAGYRAVSR